MKKLIKWFVFKCIYPLCYYFGTWRKIQTKKIVFVENHLDELSDNFTLLYNELKEQNYDVYVHYLMVSRLAWSKVIVRTLQMIWNISTASCIFIAESNSVFGAFSLRDESKLVQVWHACGAFKKWGFSVAEKSFGDDKKTLESYSGHRNYSLVPVSGTEVCFAYEEAFGLPKDSKIVKPIGVSRTDVFFDEEKKALAFEKLEAIKITKAEKKIVLYAPTFRGDIKGAKAPEFDISAFCDKFHNEYILLVKQHPFVKENTVIDKKYSDICFDVTNSMDIEDLLMVADVCITDYSSIIFEYSLMEKPMLFYAYDIKDYYSERGFYYPYEEFVPGPIVKTMDELIDKLLKIESINWDCIKQFQDKYMSGCDGHSTKRILQEVIDENLVE